MGEVFRAEDLRLGQPVALKFLPAELEHDDIARERLLAEVRLAPPIAHPNVCRVYDIGDLPAEGDTPARTFLSMEYIDGDDLRSLLRRIGRQALDIARQPCAGLSAAHTKGVLHRDLKPANVMIDGRGQARIADFGIAVETADDTEDSSDNAGTLAFMAPERATHDVGGSERLSEARTAPASTMHSATAEVTWQRFRKARVSSSLPPRATMSAATNPSLAPINLRTPGVHHIAIRCTDLARAREFYVERLGFPLLLDSQELFIFTAGTTPFAIRAPGESTRPDDAFDPFRVGLDHIALTCADVAELQRVADALRTAGIWTTGVKTDPALSKDYVAFKDPDGVKWELYMA